ncbi:hypothetical protein AUK40_02375 [Candidatus Wirthbacteria bacterium CG2_30_54_11]|uniref:O-antigen polymerase n=1 Tax=Candidatus Wirthbacteria bacterium CG2_30_54_11 TaxID=1817892 RepID=A0A1J5J034_9BACT|nr:MAG: hypothetical protein AUK40_02375 [Candidatus Wirthbacteria bacterium CG2_30_54_11]
MEYAVQIFLFLVIVLPKLAFIAVPGSGVGIRWDDFAVALLGLFTLVQLIRHPSSRALLKDRISLIFLTFLAWSLTVTLAAVALGKVPNTSVGLLYWGRLVQFYLVYLLARLGVWDRKAVKQLAWLFSSAVVLVMLYAWGQVAGIVPYFSTLTSLLPMSEVNFLNTGVVMSTFGGHYDFGIFLVMVLSFTLSGVFYCIRNAKILHWTRKMKALVFFGCAAVSVSAFVLLILTRSRSAYIALVAVIFVLGLMYQPILIALSAVISAILGLLFFQGKLSTFQRLVSFGQSYYAIDMSTYERLQKWMAVARDITIVSLFTGHGLSSLGPAVDGYYVRTLGETGMIGLSIFCLLLVAVFRQLLTLRKGKAGITTFFAEGVMLSLIAIATQAVFIDTFVSSKVMYVFWILVAVVTSLQKDLPKPGDDGSMKAVI